MLRWMQQSTGTTRQTRREVPDLPRAVPIRDGEWRLMAEHPSERRVTRPAGREDTAVRPAADRTASGARTASRLGAVTPPVGAAPPPAAPSKPPATAPAKPPRSDAKRTGAADRKAKAPAAAPGSGTRRARLRLTRVDPWSVMKTAFLLSIALGVVTIVSVFMVWSVLSAAGVWDSINSTVQDIVGGQDASNFDVENYLGTSRVLGFTMLVAVVDVVLLTAMATLGAFLYNMAAQLLGGIEVTLSEDH